MGPLQSYGVKCNRTSPKLHLKLTASECISASLLFTGCTCVLCVQRASPGDKRPGGHAYQVSASREKSEQVPTKTPAGTSGSTMCRVSWSRPTRRSISSFTAFLGTSSRRFSLGSSVLQVSYHGSVSSKFKMSRLWYHLFFGLSVLQEKLLFLTHPVSYSQC